MIILNPESLDLATLRQLWQGVPARLDDASLDRIRASAASVERIVAGGETVYGVNTGFGLLANTRIPPERLAELQRNLILSHSCGLGDALPRHVVRLMIVLKLLGLGRGYSGVRPLVIDALQDLLDRDAGIGRRAGQGGNVIERAEAGDRGAHIAAGEEVGAADRLSFRMER